MSEHYWSRFEYDPSKDESRLVPLILALLESPPQAYDQWRRVLRQYPKPAGGFFSKTEIIAGFRLLSKQHAWGVSEKEFISLVKMKPMRTQSGVTPVTVLTKPYPCPGQCIFCPNDVRMPKSYLADEPGAQRAALNRFDPYAQTWNRLLAFHRMGHDVEKIELIILGGTWSSYPREYQTYFVTRCFEACNEFDSSENPQAYHPSKADHDNFLALEALASLVPAEGESLNAYNHAVSQHLRLHHNGRLLAEHESVQWERLEGAHTRNEDTKCRIVGLVIETRPDEITPKEVLHLRRLGATKVQIGVQSMSDEVLAKNRRGHDVERSRAAINQLRLAGFKIHAHWMANLYGATVESDIEDFAKLFADHSIRPDELKLYPCSLIPRTELMTYFESGAWRPYTREELLEVLCATMPEAPLYCRLSRVIRDIPASDIHEGNQESNFREVAEKEMSDRGIKLKEIRAREVRLKTVNESDVEYRIHEYETTVSREYFLSYETDDALLGFCRLSIPTGDPITPELADSAMIREVHVYGQSLKLGQDSGSHAQHRGLGRRLCEHAEEIARGHGVSNLAVISAVGTRHYYRRLGFVDGPLYLHRAL
jgi:elongator complex protein 3